MTDVDESGTTVPPPVRKWELLLLLIDFAFQFVTSLFLLLMARFVLIVDVGQRLKQLG